MIRLLGKSDSEPKPEFTSSPIYAVLVVVVVVVFFYALFFFAGHTR